MDYAKLAEQFGGVPQAAPPEVDYENQLHNLVVYPKLLLQKLTTRSLQSNLGVCLKLHLLSL